MSRFILVVLACLFTIVSSTSAKVSMTVRENFVQGKAPVPQMILWTNSPIKEGSKIGVGTYILGSKTYAELFFGLQYTSTHVYGAVYAGLETTKHYRFAGELKLSAMNSSLYNYLERGFETGASGWCLISEATSPAVPTVFNVRFKAKAYTTYVNKLGFRTGPGFSIPISKVISVTPIILYNTALSSNPWSLQLNMSAGF